jgi:hypothetical protein
MARETVTYKHGHWKAEMEAMRVAYTGQILPAMEAMLGGLHRADAGDTQIALFTVGIARVRSLVGDAEAILATSGAEGDRVAEVQKEAGGRAEVYGAKEAHQS